MVGMTSRVMSHESCPRCNGAARVLAVKARKGSDAMSVVMKCSKCQYRNVLGFTTEFALKAMKRKERLEQMLSETESTEERTRILGELLEIERRTAMRDMM